MTKEIAVIGIAGRFPEARNIGEFLQNLRDGRDSVKKLSKERVIATNIEDKDYRILGFLEDVDKFDHKLFNISMVEAQNMDPNQKIVLELVYEAFESAGYNPQFFNGSRTAVIVGATDLQYYRHIEHFEPTMYSGNTHFTTAGRIARQFNLHGSGATIDTGCSSALVALHFACKEIWSGDADYAIATGHRLLLFPAENKPLVMDVGITSRDGKTRSFAANSNGSGASETIAAVILKPLDKALEDKDVIHAVIRSSAVNQNGLLSGSLTATSSVAQAELIKDAWKRAGVDPLSVTYIEAHGSGTQLGDPIEIGGINLAYKDYTDRKKIIAVSSVKSNIGHTDTAAGIAGFVKGVLAVKYGELFPSVHFDVPNPFIDFENSVGYINTELKPWVPECRIRRAGVSSFGFAGNNCHFILEEPPVQEIAKEDGKPYLVTISSKRKGGVKANASALLDSLKKNRSFTIPNISYTLNLGRQHFSHRFAAIARSSSGLEQLLESFISKGEEKNAQEIRSLMFIFSDSAFDESTVQALRRYAVFTKEFDAVCSSGKGENIKKLAFQLALYRLLGSKGLNTPNLLGTGLGDITVSVILNEMSLEEGIRSAEQYKAGSVTDLDNRLRSLVERESAGGKVAFIEIGGPGEMSEGLASLQIRDKEELYSSFTVGGAEDPILQLFTELYLEGYNVNWSGFYENEPVVQKIELPGYQFEKIRCWIKEPGQVTTGMGVLSETSDGREEIKSPVEERTVSISVNESWTDIQKKIAKIWALVLKLDTVNLDDDFFKLGGHSLFGVQVINRIEKEFGVKLLFKDILTFSTIRLLAKGVEMLLGNSGKTGPGEIKPAAPKEAYVLSHSQKRLWVINEMEGSNLAYNLPAFITIDGPVDKARLEETFRQLISRHEILRTSFHLEESGPVQKVHDEADFSVDFFEMKENETEARIKAFVRPFDLSAAPLLRVALGSVSDTRHILLYDMHHIVCDGVASEKMNREFVSIYLGESLPELKIQYKDYAEWQNGFLQSSAVKEQEAYWTGQFSGEVPVLQLPLDFSRPEIQSFEGAGIDFTLDEKITSALKNVCAEKGVTLYMLLLSVYNVLLHKNSGQRDIVVGSPIAGRNHPDLEHLIGIFVNMLAYRNKPAGDKKFSDFILEVKQTCLKAYENQDYPFEALVDKLDLGRDLSRNPLFDTMFLFHNNSSAEGKEIAGLMFGVLPFTKTTTQFDLTLEVKEGEKSLDMRFEYCSKLFRRATVERMKGHFINILEQLIRNPEVTIQDIDVISEAEKKQLVQFSVSQGTTSYDTTLAALFEKQAGLTPSARAVVNGDRTYTYSETDSYAARVANAMLGLGVKKGDIIALVLERSEWMTFSMLGIHKAGAAYLPIDPSYPDDRIRYMLEDSRAAAVICDREHAAKLKALTSAPVIETDTLAKGEAGKVQAAVSPDDLAYVIYTSGSTGAPKGVMIQHKGIVNRIEWMRNKYAFGPGCTVLQKTPYVFDVSVWEFFMTLCYGGTLVVCSRENSYDPQALLDQINKASVTHLHFVPGMLTAFLSVLEGSGRSGPNSLKHVFASGEALNAATVKRFYSLCDAKLHNLYGPTEASVDVSFYETTSSDETVPIGKPIDNIRLYVLDASLRQVPSGVEGELCIAGIGLAQGYINKPGLTKEKFVDNPFSAGEKLYRTGDLARWNSSGDLEFLGRMDEQVKIRGYRIEPGEIEAALLKNENVKEAAVLAFTEGDGNRALCAYIVCTEKGKTAQIRNALKSQVPDYMIPAYFVELDRLPLTHNGKTDKKKLPLPSADQAEKKALALPANETEEKLTAIFREVLEASSVGTGDNFFEIGGHSLRATVLTLKIDRVFGAKVSLREIFRNPTVKQLAALVKERQGAATGAIGAAADRALYPASSQQKRLYVTCQQEGAEKIYNMPIATLLEGDFDVQKAENAFRKIIERQESLRTSFEMKGGELFQKIHPASSLNFGIQKLENPSSSPDELISSFICPFALSNAPLFRVAVNRYSASSFLLMLDMHHIISDGVSTSILLQEFVRFYTEDQMPGELTFQYKDYAVWQNSDEGKAKLKSMEKFWLDQFEGRLPASGFPADKPRASMQTFKGYRIYDSIDRDLTARLRSVAKETGCTPFMLLFSAYTILLSKYSGSKDIVVGTPVAGRTMDELNSLIGMFVNMVALRTEVDPGQSFRELMENVKEGCLSAFENQDYPYETLADRLGLQKTSASRLFDTVFVFQNTTVTVQEIAGLRFSAVNIEPGISKFDLTFELVDNPERIELSIEFNTALYSRGSVEKLKNDFKSILAAVLKDVSVKVSEVEIRADASLIEGNSVGEFDFKGI